MATRSVSLSVAAACSGVALVTLAPTFIPGLTAQQSLASPALRAAAAPAAQAAWAGASGACAAAAAVVSATVGAALVRRNSRVASQAARRELAVAYEESGVNLVDNGKFAQGLIGSEGVWGPYEFDPLGFSKYTELVPWFREAELKHGRICMLAWLGMVVPDFLRVPGDRYSFDAVPLTIDAHDKLNGQVGVNFQILFWISIVELCCAKKVFEWNSLETAGDYGLTGFFPADEEGQKRMRLSELKNGRLAMIAFSGAITQAVLTQHTFPWLY